MQLLLAISWYPGKRCVDVDCPRAACCDEGADVNEGAVYALIRAGEDSRTPTSHMRYSNYISLFPERQRFSRPPGVNHRFLYTRHSVEMYPNRREGVKKKRIYHC